MPSKIGRQLLYLELLEIPKILKTIIDHHFLHQLYFKKRWDKGLPKKNLFFGSLHFVPLFDPIFFQGRAGVDKISVGTTPLRSSHQGSASRECWRSNIEAPTIPQTLRSIFCSQRCHKFLKNNKYQLSTWWFVRWPTDQWIGICQMAPLNQKDLGSET